ncbi:FtsX-like permease family protein [Sedimentisphaera salicampi]|uniref:Lipoprotein-releasing system transmembrane protein LolE n=1 Tax=Sedimentisphaera salicampi TaxID=1941349 RepID=A0A1W6LND3_9BACT|nr:FtsX-like permease family protein [Sedimentisphaera salicampi]ARN57274.1 Lipoprotein-releasing system transmembrane protein LolE [Sedimentisphaera salicampi]OXU14591.1 Lipoprotein-releasing system transmembrane protein LolE [Sedimentisphaera salicampi]
MLKYLLCLRYLLKVRLVVISVLAVALSCGLLVSISSVFSGFIEAVEKGASDAMGDAVIRPHPSLQISNFRDLTGRIENIENVQAASGLLNAQGLVLIGRGEVKKAQIWGIDIESQDEVTGIRDDFISSEGRFAEDSAALSIGLLTSPDPVTDKYDFDKAKSWTGKNALVLTGRQGSGEAADFRRSDLRVKIDAVSFSGINQFDSSSVYLPIETLSTELYPEKNKPLADTIQIRFAEGLSEKQQRNLLSRIQAVWSDFARNELGWPASWVGYSSISLSRDMQKRLVAEYQKQMDVLMAVFSIVSGGVVLLIFCIFYMIVMGRRKDIAILRSFGQSRGGVAGVYLLFGVFIAIAGIVLGIIFGWLFTENINTIENLISRLTGVKIWKSSVYMFSRIPNTLDIVSAMKISLYALAASLAGALLPAVIAAKTDPVKTLRYE